MTKFISDIKVFENDTVVGATVEVKEAVDGDTEVHIVNAKSYEELVENINLIKETSIKEDNLVEKINAQGSGISVGNASSLGGISGSEYSKENHKHPDDYAPKSHVEVRSTEKTLGHAKIINHLSAANYVEGEVLSANQGYILKNLMSIFDAKIQALDSKIKVLDKMQDIILDDGGVIVSSDVSYHYTEDPKTIQFYVFNKNGEPIINSPQVGSIIVVRIRDGKVYRTDNKYGTNSRGIITRTIKTAELLKSDAIGMYIVYIKFMGMTDHCMMYVHG